MHPIHIVGLVVTQIRFIDSVLSTLEKRKEAGPFKFMEKNPGMEFLYNNYYMCKKDTIASFSSAVKEQFLA